VKTVHQDRKLELVGWYTLIPKTGPTPNVLAIHNHFLSNFNDSSILLGFHPREVNNQTIGAKLPLTIYESTYEVDDPRAADDGEDKKMEDGESALKLKFRELPYSVETSDAEMISMDFVARGGGNATAVEAQAVKPPVEVKTDKKGKRRIVAAEGLEQGDEGEQVILSQEEEEMMASLTAKANAVRMLNSRVQLITKYLAQLPPSYKSGESSLRSPESSDSKATSPSHTIIRRIQGLVSRLDIVVPSDKHTFQQELLREENDVNVVGLLNEIIHSIDHAREVGKKYHLIEAAKSRQRQDHSNLLSRDLL
jgi:COP9 signalosome complex subunit 6